MDALWKEVFSFFKSQFCQRNLCGKHGIYRTLLLLQEQKIRQTIACIKIMKQIIVGNYFEIILEYFGIPIMHGMHDSIEDIHTFKNIGFKK